MAEDSDLERTEPASQRRLDQAREDGDVPRSRELATCTLLMAAGIGMWTLGEGMARALSRMLSGGLSFRREHAFEPELLLMRLGGLVFDLSIAFLPLAG